MFRLLDKSSQDEVLPVLNESVRTRLACISQQEGESIAARVLMAHEAEALFRVLERLTYDDDRVDGLLAFLRFVDPLKSDGWRNVERQEAYIASATASLSEPLWLTSVFDQLDRAQAQVARTSRMRLFRTTFLRTAIAYFITQLPPD